MATDEYRAIMTTRTSKKNRKANIANIVMMMIIISNIIIMIMLNFSCECSQIKKGFKYCASTVAAVDHLRVRG